MVVGTDTVSLTSGNTVTVTISGAADAYCIHATNPKGTDVTNGFWYKSSAGGLQPKGTAACTP